MAARGGDESKQGGQAKPALPVIPRELGAMGVTAQAIARARTQWRYTGTTRPPFAVIPKDGQESVWDYPRPPRMEPVRREVVVSAGDVELARSKRAVRVLETAGAPTVYIPMDDIADAKLLVPNKSRSLCEWKGLAQGFDLPTGERNVAWTYVVAFPEFAEIQGWIAFYPARVKCQFGGEVARPQASGYYGGWVTDNIVGPIKGEPGTDGL